MNINYSATAAERSHAQRSSRWLLERLDSGENPEPFVWTATAEQILEKVRRGRIALEAIAN